MDIFSRIGEELNIELPPQTLPSIPLYRWTVSSELKPFNDIRLQQAICLILYEKAIVGNTFPEKRIRFEAKKE